MSPREQLDGFAHEMSFTVDYRVDAALPVSSGNSCEELALSLTGSISFNSQPWKNLDQYSIGGAGGAAR